VPLIPLHGHDALRARLAEQADRGALPASLLFQGPPGVGKQRLALWLGGRLLCEAADRPCGTCQHCKYVAELQHPDLRWVFPRPKLKGTDQTLEEVQEEYEGAVRERVEARGLYARPDGAAGIYPYVTRLLVHLASRSPAMARRKVLVIGDAERMVPQASSPEAANALLKLLEEPPADTTLILTSSEPGSLLPTIRSRVVAFRVAPVAEAPMRQFLADEAASGVLPNEPADVLLRLAGGAPGALIGTDDSEAAVARARQLLAAADAGAEHALRAAFTSGSAKARGKFTDVLDALTVLLHERARDAAERGDELRAVRAARAIPEVEDAKRAAEGNVNPQLVTARLLGVLAGSAP
jgi:DNA polymerase-3 subunit delta'